MHLCQCTCPCASVLNAFAAPPAGPARRCPDGHRRSPCPCKTPTPLQCYAPVLRYAPRRAIAGETGAMRAALRSTHWCSAPKSSALRPCTTLHAHITGRTPCPLWHCTLPRPDSTAAAPRCQSVGEGPAAYSTLQCTIPVVYWWFLTCVPWGNRRALRALRAHWASLGGGGTPLRHARACVSVGPQLYFFSLRCVARHAGRCAARLHWAAGSTPSCDNPGAEGRRRARWPGEPPGEPPGGPQGEGPTPAGLGGACVELPWKASANCVGPPCCKLDFCFFRYTEYCHYYKKKISPCCRTPGPAVHSVRCALSQMPGPSRVHCRRSPPGSARDSVEGTRSAARSARCGHFAQLSSCIVALLHRYIVAPGGIYAVVAAVQCSWDQERSSLTRNSCCIEQYAIIATRTNEYIQ